MLAYRGIFNRTHHFNPALQVRTADEFVRALMTGLPPKPPGFDRIIAKNRAQALPSSGDPEPLTVAQAREAMAKGAVACGAARRVGNAGL